MDKKLIVFIILFSSGILFMLGLFILTTSYKFQMDEYCINEGYEGSANLNIGIKEFRFNTVIKEFRCYKYVKHESGLGSEIVYSGLVKLETDRSKK